MLYQSSSTLVSFMSKLFIINSILNVAMYWHVWNLFNTFTNPINTDNLQDQFFGSFSIMIFISETITFYILIVLFIVWLYRANINARALGARDMKYSPGWAVGWFFIPIMNFIKPYHAVKEVWLSCKYKEIEERKKAKTPTLLKSWWTIWILAMIFINFKTQDPSSMIREYKNWILLISSIFVTFDVIRPLLARQVVKNIYLMQERNHAETIQILSIEQNEQLDLKEDK